MPYARKVILHAPPWNSPLLGDFVEACLRDKVGLVCVIGDDCERVHDVIDELVVGDGSMERGDGPLTTWHTNETFAEVWSFALSLKLDDDPSSLVQEVRLRGPIA